MSLPNLQETCKIYLEFSKDNLISMIDQILKSPDLIADINKLSPEQIAQIKEKDGKIIDEVIERESKYYLKKFKVKKTSDFTKIFEKLPPQKLKEVRQKIAKEVINEAIPKLQK